MNTSDHSLFKTDIKSSSSKIEEYSADNKNLKIKTKEAFLLFMGRERNFSKYFICSKPIS